MARESNNTQKGHESTPKLGELEGNTHGIRVGFSSGVCEFLVDYADPSCKMDALLIT
jgi:hypothetical protein